MMKKINIKTSLFSSLLVPLLLFSLSCNLFAKWEVNPKNKTVYFVTAETTGIFFTGGLGHVLKELPPEFAKQGFKVKIIMPYYTSIDKDAKIRGLIKNHIEKAGPSITIGLDRVSEANFAIHEIFQPFLVKHPTTGVDIILMKHLPKEGQTNFLENEQGSGIYTYPVSSEQAKVFGATMKAIYHWMKELPAEEQPTAVYLNDWTTGSLAPMIVHDREYHERTPAIAYWIHNIKHQGPASFETHRWLDLASNQLYGPDGLNGTIHHHQFNSAKAGLSFSDAVMTVSNGYASEIQTPRFGEGFEGIMSKLFREDRLVGIVNGIDTNNWQPADTDLLAIQAALDPKKNIKNKFNNISANGWSPKTGFNKEDLKRELEERQHRQKITPHGKTQAKMNLQMSLFEREGINPEIPLFVMTSRLDAQKGFNSLLGRNSWHKPLKDILKKRTIQLIIMGDPSNSSDAYLEELINLEKEINGSPHDFKGKFRYLKFDGSLEKPLLSGADIFINLAEFEPCGLNQQFAAAYATLPFVSATGGLKDTVKDWINGFLVHNQESSCGKYIHNDQTAWEIIKRWNDIVDLYENDRTKFVELQLNAMEIDNSWKARMPMQIEFFNKVRSLAFPHF